MTDQTCNIPSKLQLITRLRSIHDFEHDETEAVCEEAATEIERLTTALQVETICHQVASDSNRAKREEIERLRAALEQMKLPEFDFQSARFDRVEKVLRGVVETKEAP